MSAKFGGKKLLVSFAGFLCLYLLIFLGSGWAQDHGSDNADHDHADQQGMSMSAEEMAQMGHADAAKALADKKESEFNHHLAGIFVILAGLFLVAETSLPLRLSFLRY